MTNRQDLLFEIGCEELPASFVERAVDALPELTEKRLQELRLEHAGVVALGTPRRLAIVVSGLLTEQPNLEEEVTGPPVRAAFRDGAPTKAAEAFAKKLGCAVADLERVDTPKGEYVKGTRREAGRPALELLPDMLAELVTAIPFRKSMRWGSGSISFGRPLRWLVAMLGEELVPVQLAGLEATRSSYGHRFLHPGEVSIANPADYTKALHGAHVVVDPDERRRVMIERLQAAAKEADGALIEDEFLVGENLSLVEEPQVVVGSFDEEFLELPDEVILEVARGHQRYFGLRGSDGKLLPRYLAVVNTANNPAKIALGNDRVMRARLADARFFYQEDLKQQLADRRSELGGIVFQNKLGTVLDKVARIERLVPLLAKQLGCDEATQRAAVAGASLCKCDLVTRMVGEFPELQGDVGRAYALKQGAEAAVADVIRDHYKPKGAADATAPSDAAALVALADRLDTLAGCFGVGLSPTGSADPFGLRRACIGSLRTLLDRDLDLRLADAFAAAHAGYEGVELELDSATTVDKLGAFFRDRLRGLLVDGLPTDAVDAALGVAADRPLDARARAAAIAELDTDTRSKLGEVFKRATNIAKDAPEGDPNRGTEPAEQALYDAFMPIRGELAALAERSDYAGAFGQLAGLAPVLGSYFDDVLVMADDEGVRKSRLCMMRVISQACSGLARLELLGPS
jgi:glycyl-tRNA synthetase beta chain